MDNPPRFTVSYLPKSLLGRVLSALITLAIIIAGFFFLMFALIAAAVVAAVVLTRLWWISRKLRARRDAGVIEGTYTVEGETARRIPERREQQCPRHRAVR